MGMSLTVNRTKLIDQLTAKRDETVAHYAEQERILNERLAGLATGSEAWVQYHTAVAEGLTNGTLKYTESGKIAPVGRGGGSVPVRPNAKTMGRNNWHGTRADIEADLEYVVPGGYYYQQDVTPYDAALQLLNLSEDESITIDGSDYNGLLSRMVGRNWHWS